MKLVHVLNLCAVAGVALTGCGGGASEGAAPEGVISPAAEMDPATWVKENCPLKGWKYEDGLWILTQAALTPNPDADAEDRPRVYIHDEVNRQAQATEFVSGPVCYERPAEGGDTGGVSAVDVATGDDVSLIQVKTPQGLAWVDKPDLGREVFELTYREGSEYEGFEYTPLNEFNDMNQIMVEDSEAPDTCIINGCSS
ncbi:hypothetical protein [Rothia sp. CCM 9416]|uniref:hypothetical protein n=1 Tax=Rothia sp. CCM 9416 TaxID=3402655 RepID=UPI003AEA334A